VGVGASPRQRSGQVPTPAPLADAMAAWVLAGPARTLLEPGAGGFVFSRAALRRRPWLEVTGVESDPRAGLAPPGARLIVGDFLDDATLGDRRFDAILCNPPYVRHHHLDPARKRELAARLGGRAGIVLSRLAGTHVHFLLRALELLAPGGRAAFVTGAEWLQAAYGQSLRRHLAASGLLRAVLVAHPDAEVFPGVLATAAVILLENGPPAPARAAFDLDLDALLRLTATGAGSAPVVTFDADRWSRPRPPGARLGSLFRARRGVATGANDFFVLAPPRARELRLPDRVLRPCLAGPRDLEPRRLLTLGAGPLPGPVRAYLAAGEAAGLHLRYLCRTRDPWYRVEELAPAPLLVAYMSRATVGVFANRTHAVHLNLLHGVYPRPGTPARLVSRLRRYLTSPPGQQAALSAARRYARGLHKLEPRDLEDITIPDDF
jgi:adenine-specific DNA-methyltransferase